MKNYIALKPCRFQGVNYKIGEKISEEIIGKKAVGGLISMEFIKEIPTLEKNYADEEIFAVIETSSTWKKAQFRLVESLIRRFAYEVDEKTSPAEWSWHQRFENWKKLSDELKKEADAESVSPLGNLNNSALKKPPYFFEDMHANKNFFKGRR